MAWTQTDLDTLDAAIIKHGRGELLESIQFSEQTYTFATATLEERLSLRSTIVQALNAAAGTPKTYRLAATSKGV